MTPSVGPTGYVFPLSAQYADTVSCDGVSTRLVKFHPNVMSCDGAIL